MTSPAMDGKSTFGRTRKLWRYRASLVSRLGVGNDAVGNLMSSVRILATNNSHWVSLLGSSTQLSGFDTWRRGGVR